MVDTEVLKLELIGGDMAGTNNDVGDGAGRVKCGVQGRLVDGCSVNWRNRVTSRAFYRLRVMGDCGRAPYSPIGRGKK